MNVWKCLAHCIAVVKNLVGVMAIPSALELKQLVFCVFLLFSATCNFVQHSFLKTYSEPQWPDLPCHVVDLVVNGVGCHHAAT